MLASFDESKKKAALRRHFDHEAVSITQRMMTKSPLTGMATTDSQTLQVGRLNS
jgi:hypothetical protein